MRLRVLLVLAVLASGMATSRSYAQVTPPAATPDATEEARRHFKRGIRLYQDANYGGALAEFEAAYTKKPTPGSLQNIALCQKALFRYGEAADTLARLLREHATELDAGERTAAELAREELESLVGSLLLDVKPPHARVLLDGKPLAVEDRQSALRVNVGEHTVVAEAPGYASISRSVRVAGGQRDVRVDIVLEANSGFLEISAGDPSAIIAIDGRPVAMGHFVGPVPPGEDHLVQVYKSGFEPFEQRVRVERGKTLSVRGVLGPAGGEPMEPPAAAGELPPPPGAKRPLGFYALAALTLLGTNAKPYDVDLASAEAGAAALGVRAGRRIWPTLALEGLVELGRHAVTGACDRAATRERLGNCSDSDHVEAEYSVGWLRFGPTFRIMNSDDKLRLVGGIGAGLVWHALDWKSGAATERIRNGGLDPYFLLELGVMMNFRHLVVGLEASALVDGTRGLDDGAARGAFAREGRTLSFLGIGVRIGYSEWSPRR